MSNNDAKMKRMEDEFKRLDTNGDNCLDEQELGELLRKGNPNFSDREVADLFKRVDANHDGRVDFREFLNYCYKSERTGGGRHQRLAHAGAVGDDGTEIDWSACSKVFTDFAGKDMDGKEFAKFCKDNNLLGHGMTKTDVDLIFAKVVPKGQRRMDFNMFKDAVRNIAQKRKQTTGEIQGVVSNSTGPILTGTKQDAVRFYDDKTTFTGSHAHNENFEGTDTTHGGDRHGAQQARTDALLHGGDAAIEDDWGPLEVTFNSFAGPEKRLEGREFKKMCDEISGLIGGGFTKNDVDVVFTACKSKGSNYLLFDGFQEVCRRVAVKKSTTTAAVQQIVAASAGPHLNATKADAVRFHDDKNTYTGAHAAVHGRDGLDQRDTAARHEQLASQHAQLNQGGGDEQPWEPCDAVFETFCEGQGTMEGRQFMKLCEDARLIGKGLTKNDVDVVFTAACVKGQRRLDVNNFIVSMRNVAAKKSMSVSEVQDALRACSGPHIVATQAEYSRFHDDKTTYTGMHAEQ